MPPSARVVLAATLLAALAACGGAPPPEAATPIELPKGARVPLPPLDDDGVVAEASAFRVVAVHAVDGHQSIVDRNLKHLVRHDWEPVGALPDMVQVPPPGLPLEAVFRQGDRVLTVGFTWKDPTHVAVTYEVASP